MKFSMRKLYLLLPLLAFSFFTCKQSADAPPKQVISIGDVYYTDAENNDGDSYYSYARLNFELNINRGEKNVYIQIGVRVHTAEDTATWYLYYQFDAFSLDENLIPWVAIGYPNDELLQGGYDFDIRVFEVGNDESTIVYKSPADDDDLNNAPFEPSSTDVGITVDDAWWDNRVDNDGDGYYSSGTLWLDVDAPGTSADIFFALWGKLSSASEYDLVYVSEEYTIEGYDYGDSYGLDFGVNNAGHYDFLYDVYFTQGVDAELTYDDNDDSDLYYEPLEPVADDVPLITDATWLWHNDGSYEVGIYYPEVTSYFAVQFYKPAGAITCRVTQIAVRIDGNPSYGLLNLWDSSLGKPDQPIWSASSSNYMYAGWNEYGINIDVTNYNPFYAGYWQAQVGAPYLSADTSPPISGTSFWYSISTSSWQQDFDYEYAIEVYVEYTILGKRGNLITKGEWIEAN